MSIKYLLRCNLSFKTVTKIWQTNVFKLGYFSKIQGKLQYYGTLGEIPANNLESVPPLPIHLKTQDFFDITLLMTNLREDANKLAFILTNKYRNIRYKNLNLPVPYFINTAEQEYKKAMLSSGIKQNHIRKVMELIKNGQTALGSTGGKGSPEEIEKDLDRLMSKLEKMGFRPKTKRYIRRWMKEMHIGLDCSGYVYNILKNIEETLKIDILNTLAWEDQNTKEPSHAGAFIFDSDNLETITDKNFKPLDILVFKNHRHVGILLETSGKLYLADCSMGRDGISLYDFNISEGEISIKNSSAWNREFSNGNVISKRLKL